MTSDKLRCAGCGFESDREDSFKRLSRWFGRKTRVFCPICFTAAEDRVIMLVFWAYTVIVLIAIALAVFLPTVSFGPWLLNVACLQIFVLICTIMHELGHAVAARLVGFRVFGIEIGHGRVVADFLFAGLRWQFRSVLFGGFALATPRDSKFYRIRESVFILGGPVVNGLLLVAAIAALPWDSSLESTTFKGCVPFLMLALSNASLLVYSLWPHRYDSRYGKVANDILLLWETWRRPHSEIQQIPPHWYLREAEEYQRQGQHEEAKKWIDKGLLLYPDNFYLQYRQADNFSSLKRYADSHEAHVALLDQYGKSGPMRSLLLNNLAFANLLSGDPEFLREAETYSQLALKEDPSNVYYKGTRGAVLVEIGQYADGLKLLHQALLQHTERPAQALDACFIGIAEAKLGNQTESRNYFAMARKLDPQCFLLDREQQIFSASTQPTIPP